MQNATHRRTDPTTSEHGDIASPDLLDDVLADDGVDAPMVPGQRPGRAGLKPMMQAFLATFADLTFRN